MTTSSRTTPGVFCGHALARPVRAILLAAAVAAASGCAGAAEQPATHSLSATEQSAVEVAKRRLAAADNRLVGVSLQSIEPRQWNDTSLGCPQRGMSYLQVITDGYLITFKSARGTHEVRVAGENTVICPLSATGEVRVPGSAARVTNLTEMEREAVADLAKRLGVDAGSIKVARRVPQRWQDETLGCNETLGTTLVKDGPVAGFRLLLSHDGRTFTYHTDLKRVMACPPIEAD